MEIFEKNVQSLSDSLAFVLGKPSSFYQNELRRARANNNRYYLARDLSYTDYIKNQRILFKLGAKRRDYYRTKRLENIQSVK
jgi:cell division protein FtsI (penicillin-binding protein 3)